MGINQAIYKARREAFMSKLNNGTAIFVGANPCKHKYRQDSNFYYLTGFKEPGSVLVLAPEHPEHKYILFVRPRDKSQEIWTGKRAGIEGAKEEYCADEAYPINEIDNFLPKYIENVDNIYYSLGSSDDMDSKIIGFLRRFRGKRYDSCSGPVAIIDPMEIVRDMRSIKDQHEIELIKKSADISSEAHISAMKSVKPGMYEYELQAILEYNFLKNGAMSPAYPSIVGSGSNATCLHYDFNDCMIEDNHLVLIDAGAEYEYYAADITRTFPANGKFTPLQRDLYNIVLSAQISAINEIKPGASMDAFHEKAVQVISEGLISIGLIKEELSKVIEEKLYNKFYMHNTGHWLGLDVHDVGSRKIGDKTKTFQPGMIVTVEPGLYIAEDMEEVSEEYRGIGIRIEDDILVTENGNEILTQKAPKTIEDIEHVMAEG